MTQKTIQRLRATSLFADLSGATLEQISRVAYERRYSPGEIIIFEGDLCQSVYFIVEGQVRVYRLASNARQQILLQLGPGETFNAVPPFRPAGGNHATVEALTDVTLYAIASDDFRRLVETCGELALVILKDFAHRLDHLTNLVEDLSLRTVRERLARFLLDRAEAGAVTRRWTQEEIAAQLGTVRDVVCRTLRAFADAELTRMERQQIVLLDRAGLEEEAGV
ncbi:MAG TPA: Crp/Fnr family transcriptional regulator [Chloroflexi bacterium]|nr:Crp/Fnr family transcriptional regulator [Chloroflexota bacterium]